jgi:hypothetical protein
MSIRLKGLAGTALLLLSLGAQGGTITLNTMVQRVMVVGDNRFGGCMALLAHDPAAQLPGCAGNWVSFSCTGDFAEPVRAYRMLDQAQLALAAGKRVLVQVTDSKKHNGYCYCSRIDVIR